MSGISKIHWTDATWNPCAGCSKISPGCRNCYAIRNAKRMAGNPNKAMQAAYQGLVTGTPGNLDWNGTVRTLPDRLWPGNFTVTVEISATAGAGVATSWQSP